jgi:dienelactone hydrolase
LASHGFIVVAVDDIVHWQPLTGDEAKAQSAAMPTISVENWDRFRPVAALRAGIAARLGSKMIDALASSEPFDRSIDFDKIGAIGYSFGGATAAQLSRADKRIKAIVNFDGSLYGDAERLGVDVPYVMFFSDFKYPSEYELTRGDGPTQVDALLKKEAVAHQILQSAKPDNWTYVVKHTVHEDFCDRMLKPPIEAALRARRLTGAKTWSELNKYLVAFFDRYLLHSDGRLLGTAPFAEIRPFLETLTPPAQSLKSASIRKVF